MRRRSYMTHYYDFEPLYHWSVEDELENNKWVDRIQGLPWSVSGNVPSKVEGGWQLGVSYGSYFVMDMKSTKAANGTIGLNLGQYYRIEVTTKILSVPTSATTWLGIWDFASLGTSGHGLGLLVNYTKLIFDNCKLFDNNTTYSAKRIFRDPGTKFTISVGCTKYDDSTDIQYIKMNNISYSGRPHSPTTFNHNFYYRDGYLGRGYNLPYSEGTCIIYDLIIYKENLI